MPTTIQALASQLRTAAASPHLSAGFAPPAGSNAFKVSPAVDAVSLASPLAKLAIHIESSRDNGQTWRHEVSRVWQGGPQAGQPWVRFHESRGVDGRTFRVRIDVTGSDVTLGADLIFDTFNLAAYQGPKLPASISFQQSKSADTGSGLSMSLSYTSNNTVNNLLVLGTDAFISAGAAIAISSISDTLTNTWVVNSVTADTPIGGGGGERVAGHYVKACKSSGANTVTITPASSTTNMAMALFEYAGNDTQAPLAATNSGSGTSTSPSSGAATSAPAGSLFWGFVAFDAAGETVTPEAGWTERINGAGNPNIDFDAEELIGSGTNTATWTLSSSTSWGAIVMAFKAATTLPAKTIVAGQSVSGATYF